MNTIKRFGLILAFVGGIFLHPPYIEGANSNASSKRGKPEVQAKGAQKNVVNRGFIILEGEYLELPYTFEGRRNDLRLNGISLVDNGVNLEMYQGDWVSAANELASWLGENNTLVLSRSLPPALLPRAHAGFDLLRLLHDDGLISKAETPELFNWLEMCEADISTWQTVHASFRGSGEFSQRYDQEYQLFVTQYEGSEASSMRLRWEQRLAYPLTITAMILIVISIGHLLSYRPQDLSEPIASLLRTNVDRVIRFNLGLVALFSVLDLMWTLLSNSAGTMAEINPIAKPLMDSPLLLTGFKLTLTAIAVGLLYQLRRWPIARSASWWACLVLTLVTARWVLFNSMFMQG